MQDWRTEKALLEQENSLLEMQIKELKEREDSYKVFNESILNCYNSLQCDVTKQNVSIYKQLQQTLETYSKELIESKNRTTSNLIVLEEENKTLKNYLEQLEYKLQEQREFHQNELNEYETLNTQIQQNPATKLCTINRKKSLNKEQKERKENKENNKPEQGGCIVTIKQRNEIKKKELCVSKVLNCKDSNVMEISQLDWLDQSSPTGLFKQFHQQQQRDREISDYQRQQSRRVQRDNRKSDNDSISPQYIRRNASNAQNTYVTPDTKEIKQEVKLMINKLLAQDKSVEKNSFRQEKRSLAEFTKQINSVRSTENFQQILRQSQLTQQ